MQQRPQRDERGRFIRRNTVAFGNKGNRQPKHGNKNAVKHGMYSRQLFAQRNIGDDLILIAFHNGLAVRFFKGEWIDHGDGFTIIGDKALYAKELLGMQFKQVMLSGDIEQSEMNYDEFIESSVIFERQYLSKKLDELYQ